MRFLAGGSVYTRRTIPRVTDDPLGWARGFVGWCSTEFQNIMRAVAPTTTIPVTSAYTAQVTDGLILADATGAPFTVTLPAVGLGALVAVKRINAGGNAVTLGGTVEGVVNPTLGSQYSSKTVWSDGTTYYTIAAT